LELPFKYENKRDGVYITFSKKETNQYLKLKNYIEKDEELNNFFLIENKGSKFINNDLDFDCFIIIIIIIIIFNLNLYILVIYI